MENIKGKIQEIVKEFFQMMGVIEEPENFNIEQGVISFDIQTNEPEILIGKRGQTIDKIQLILAKIVSKKLGARVFVDFDVNGYKKRKIDYLKKIANEIAEEVAITKEERALPPMTPFERRIIHIALSNRVDITTKSEGENSERRVVIKVSGA